MKKIDISQIVSPTSKQPFTANSLKFKQDYDAENYAALVKAFITQSTGSYSLTVPYVISGCVLSGTYNITAGEIFYGGSFYSVTALSTSVNPIRLILATTYDVTADPLIFTDGVAKNVHEIYTYVSTDVASGGILASSLVSVYGSGKIFQDIKLASFTSTSITYVNITSLTYTILKTANYLIVGNSSYNYSTSAGNGADLQIWNGSSELATSKVYLSITAVSIDTATLPTSCSYVGPLTAGTVINLRVKQATSTTSNFLNNSLSIIEV